MRPTAAAVTLVVLSSATALLQQARLTPEEQREFLRSARIVDARPIGRGVTGAERLTLTNGITTHDASFQSIDERTTMRDRLEGRRRAGEVNFVDSYKYNIAAYELARLLTLDDMVPVTVERTWRGRTGALSWWVDDVMMDEAEREASDAQPTSALAFQRQRMRMAVFEELLGDVDRNKTNILYTMDWRVIMIDFTRAFRLHRELRTPQGLMSIERRLWEALQRLTRDDVERAVDSQLTPVKSRPS